MTDAATRGALFVAALAGLSAIVLVGEALLAANTVETAPGRGRDLDGLASFSGSGERTVVWLGDSTVAGIGSSAVSGTLPWLVAERTGGDTQLDVRAVSGARVADAIDQAGAIDSQPDTVYIGIGSNDATHFTALASFRRRYESVLRRIPASARVVMLGVPDMGSMPHIRQPLRAVFGWRGRQLDREVERLAAEHGAMYVELATTTGPVFRSDPGTYFSVDGYHPDDDGYALWADEIVKQSAP